MKICMKNLYLITMCVSSLSIDSEIPIVGDQYILADGLISEEFNIEWQFNALEYHGKMSLNTILK